MSLIEHVTESVLARGDLAHLALLLWAGAASLFCALVLRDLAAANKRFDDFVRELARFNRRHAPERSGHPDHNHERGR
jgi:hypothetical protein